MPWFCPSLAASLLLHCRSVLSLPPIKDRLQQSGEGCDWRLVQALLCDASRLECCQMFFQCMFSFYREKHVSLDTCAAGVATQMKDVPALVMRFSVRMLMKRGATTPSSLNTKKSRSSANHHNFFLEAVALRVRFPLVLWNSCITLHRKYMQSFFFGGVNWRVQLQFLALVELFLKQLNRCSF